MVSVRSQTTGLVASQRDQARHDIAAAYARAGSWQKADLAGAQALADSTGARLIILGTSGEQVTTLTPAHMPGHEPGRGTGGTNTPGMDHGGQSTEPSHSHHQGDGAAAVARPPPFRLRRPIPRLPQPRGHGNGHAGSGGSAGPGDGPARQACTVLVDFPAASQTPAWQARDALSVRLA